MKTKTETANQETVDKTSRAAVALTLFWDNIDWDRVEKKVVGIQYRIVEAAKNWQPGARFKRSLKRRLNRVQRKKHALALRRRKWGNPLSYPAAARLGVTRIAQFGYKKVIYQ